MTETWAVGFAGAGEIDPKAIAALLDDWLPQDDLVVFLPEKVSRSAKGLKAVRTWMEEVEQDFMVTGALVEDLVSADADKTFMVLLWGDEGDENSEDLLQAALAAGIPVKDLTHALDDLRIEEETPETEDSPEDTEDATAAIGAIKRDPEPDEAQAAAGKNYVGKEEVEALGEEVYGTVDVGGGLGAQLGVLLEEMVRAVVSEMLAEALPKPGPVGRPRKDGIPAGQATEDDEEVTVIYDEDTEEYLVAGRGRPKKGQTRVKMTRGEARAKGVIFPAEEETPF